MQSDAQQYMKVRTEEDMDRSRRWMGVRVFVTGFLVLLLLVCGWFFLNMDIAAIDNAQIFNIAIGLVSMAGMVVLCLIYSIDRIEASKSAILYYFLIILVFLGLVTDNMSGLLEGKPEYRGLFQIECTISFLILPILASVFWYYQGSLFTGEEFIQKKLSYVFVFLLIVDIPFLLIGCANGYIFYIDEAGFYQAGRGIVISAFFPLIMPLICILDSIRRDIPAREKISLLAFSLTPILAAGTLSSEYDCTYVIMFLDLLLIYGGIHMERSIHMAEQDRELLEQKTQIMLSQIQPHFLYNTLNTVSGLCEEDPLLARDVVDEFAVYLRANMDSMNNGRLIPFSQELEHTKTYIWIEQQRFGEFLKVEYDIQYSDFEIPSLTLQPLVENAVKHGVCKLEEGGLVTISVVREGKRIRIFVKDNGPGFDIRPGMETDRSHVGIANVRARLETLCGGVLKIRSIPGRGTVAEIQIYQER